MALKIAQIGLSDTDSHRLKTLLGMAVINSASLRQKWVFGDTADANLIVTGSESEEGRAIINAPVEKAGRVYAILAGQADAVPAGCLKLPWPIRMEDLLLLLQAVEQRTKTSAEPDTATAVPEPATDNGLIRLASFLRDSDNSGSNAAWKIEGASRRPIHIAPGEKVFYFGESLSNLREIDADIQLNFVPVPIEELSELAGRKPLAMLQWLVGLQTGPYGLLPWIDNKSAMKLRRFPAFQILHHTTAHRRVAAVLSRPRREVDTIAELAGVEPAFVRNFINAANLCGYLIQVDGKSSKLAARTGTAKRPRSLFKSFRKALGIESVNV